MRNCTITLLNPDQRCLMITSFPALLAILKTLPHLRLLLPLNLHLLINLFQLNRLHSLMNHWVPFLTKTMHLSWNIAVLTSLDAMNTKLAVHSTPLLETTDPLKNEHFTLWNHTNNSQISIPLVFFQCLSIDSTNKSSI